MCAECDIAIAPLVPSVEGAVLSAPGTERHDSTAMMQALRDDDEHLSELDTNPLAQLDSERVRVQSELCEAIAKGRCAPSDDAVPTELLAEDLEVEIELPQREPCEAALYVADQPRSVLGALFGLAAICSLWVAMTPGERFAVDDSLFEPRSAPDVQFSRPP